MNEHHGMLSDDYFHSPGSWTFGLKGNKKKYFPLTGNLEENLQTLLHIVVKKGKKKCILSPPPGYWFGIADSRPLPSTMGVWGGTNRTYRRKQMPCYVIKACGECCGNKCKFWSFMETDGVRNCTAGDRNSARKPHNGDGEKVLNLVACQTHIVIHTLVKFPARLWK